MNCCNYRSQPLIIALAVFFFFGVIEKLTMVWLIFCAVEFILFNIIEFE